MTHIDWSVKFALQLFHIRGAAGVKRNLIQLHVVQIFQVRRYNRAIVRDAALWTSRLAVDSRAGYVAT